MESNAYSFDVENDIITIIAQGKRDASTAQAVAESVLAYRRYVASPGEGRKFIIDFRQVVEVPEQAVDAIVAAHHRLNFTAVAVVRHNNWQRAFIDLVIAKTGRADQYRSFDNMEDARRWIMGTPLTAD